MTAKEFHRIKGALSVQHSRRDKHSCELTLAPGTSITSNDLTRWVAWQVEILAVQNRHPQAAAPDDTIPQLQIFLREYQ